jgi:HK97 family phage portal protein
VGFFDSAKLFLRTGVWTRSLVKYSSWEVLRPAYALTDADAYVRDGYRANSLVYRCTELLATSVSTPNLTAVLTTPEGDTELPLADPLTRLLERPSPDYSGQTRFVRQAVRLLMLTGEAIMYKVPGQRSGRVVELQLLASSTIEVERTQDGEKTFLYRPDPTRAPIRLRSEEVIFLKLDDPISKDRGLSPLAAAARETDTDNEATNFRKAFFQNGGIPSGVLTTERPATPKELEEWAAMWRERYSGSKNAGKTPALAGGLKYQRAGALPNELAFPELTGLSESRICQAFGVPPVLVGAKVGLDRSTYNNYANARRSFWEDTVSPLLEFLEDELTDGLTDPEDRRRVAFDTSKVPALQEDAGKVEERYRRALEAGAITVNEYREKIGLDPADDGEVYLRPGKAIVVPVGEGAEAEEEEQDVRSNGHRELEDPAVIVENGR